MEADKEIVGKVIDQSGGVLDKAYDDLAHPSAKSLGNTISLIPRTVGVWLGKWEKWVINGEESIRLTTEAVKEKAAKIPEEKLVEPEPYVAVPAIQQLSYCYNCEELRELYANLLVSSMNTDTKNQVHPSFVDIIKQLTPDEAKLISAIPTESQYFPLIDLQVNLGENNGHITIYQNYTLLGQDICAVPENIGIYIENLDRLKLIHILEDIHLMNAGKYYPLENSPVFLSHMNVRLVDEQEYKIHRKSFYLTEFGKSFINVCTDNKI